MANPPHTPSGARDFFPQEAPEIYAWLKRDRHKVGEHVLDEYAAARESPVVGRGWQPPESYLAMESRLNEYKARATLLQNLIHASCFMASEEIRDAERYRTRGPMACDASFIPPDMEPEALYRHAHTLDSALTELGKELAITTALTGRISILSKLSYRAARNMGAPGYYDQKLQSDYDLYSGADYDQLFKEYLSSDMTSILHLKRSLAAVKLELASKEPLRGDDEYSRMERACYRYCRETLIPCMEKLQKELFENAKKLPAEYRKLKSTASSLALPKPEASVTDFGQFRAAHPPGQRPSTETHEVVFLRRYHTKTQQSVDGQGTSR